MRLINIFENKNLPTYSWLAIDEIERFKEFKLCPHYEVQINNDLYKCNIEGINDIISIWKDINEYAHDYIIQSNLNNLVPTIDYIPFLKRYPEYYPQRSESTSIDYIEEEQGYISCITKHDNYKLTSNSNRFQKLSKVLYLSYKTMRNVSRQRRCIKRQRNMRRKKMKVKKEPIKTHGLKFITSSDQVLLFVNALLENFYSNTRLHAIPVVLTNKQFQYRPLRTLHIGWSSLSESVSLSIEQCKTLFLLLFRHPKGLASTLFTLNINLLSPLYDYIFPEYLHPASLPTPYPAIYPLIYTILTIFFLHQESCYTNIKKELFSILTNCFKEEDIQNVFYKYICEHAIFGEGKPVYYSYYLQNKNDTLPIYPLSLSQYLAIGSKSKEIYIQNKNFPYYSINNRISQLETDLASYIHSIASGEYRILYKDPLSLLKINNISLSNDINIQSNDNNIIADTSIIETMNMNNIERDENIDTDIDIDTDTDIDIDIDTDIDIDKELFTISNSKEDEDEEEEEEEEEEEKVENKRCNRYIDNSKDIYVVRNMSQFLENEGNSRQLCIYKEEKDIYKNKNEYWCILDPIHYNKPDIDEDITLYNYIDQYKLYICINNIIDSSGMDGIKISDIYDSVSAYIEHHSISPYIPQDIVSFHRAISTAILDLENQSQIYKVNDYKCHKYISKNYLKYYILPDLTSFSVSTDSVSSLSPQTSESTKDIISEKEMNKTPIFLHTHFIHLKKGEEQYGQYNSYTQILYVIINSPGITITKLHSIFPTYLPIELFDICLHLRDQELIGIKQFYKSSKASLFSSPSILIKDTILSDFINKSPDTIENTEYCFYPSNNTFDQLSTYIFNHKEYIDGININSK
ncbi:hypothetical protein WA158_003942 [Blastocystis sp. Blastoise]